MPCPYSHFITRAYATPIFTFRTCSYSVPINTLVLVHVPFHGRVFVFGVCAYYRNASGSRQSRVHVWCVCLLQERQRSRTSPWCSCLVCVPITITPAGPDKAMFMFGACLLQERQWVQTRPCSCLVCVPITGTQWTETKPCSCLVRVSITGTPAGPDNAVFVFGACVYYRNASWSRQGRGVHFRCMCLLQERQRVQTKPCSC